MGSLLQPERTVKATYDLVGNWSNLYEAGKAPGPGLRDCHMKIPVTLTIQHNTYNAIQCNAMQYNTSSTIIHKARTARYEVQYNTMLSYVCEMRRYGSIYEEAVDFMFRECGLTAEDRFLDIGSGIGQIVTQAAAWAGCPAAVSGGDMRYSGCQRSSSA